MPQKTRLERHARGSNAARGDGRVLDGFIQASRRVGNLGAGLEEPGRPAAPDLSPSLWRVIWPGHAGDPALKAGDQVRRGSDLPGATGCESHHAAGMVASRSAGPQALGSAPFSELLLGKGWQSDEVAQQDRGVAPLSPVNN